MVEHSEVGWVCFKSFVHGLMIFALRITPNSTEYFVKFHSHLPQQVLKVLYGLGGVPHIGEYVQGVPVEGGESRPNGCAEVCQLHL